MLLALATADGTLALAALCGATPLGAEAASGDEGDGMPAPGLAVGGGGAGWAARAAWWCSSAASQLAQWTMILWREAGVSDGGGLRRAPPPLLLRPPPGSGLDWLVPMMVEVAVGGGRGLLRCRGGSHARPQTESACERARCASEGPRKRGWEGVGLMEESGRSMGTDRLRSEEGRRTTKW